MVKSNEPDDEIGKQFFQVTKYMRDEMTGNRLNWTSKPKTYKKYPQMPEFVLHPPEKLKFNRSLRDIFQLRRSKRRFSSKAMTLEAISYLCWGATGISKDNGNFQYRTAPSAGALYPIETYVVLNQSIQDKDKVTSIPSGIYHYNILKHSLEQLKVGNFGYQIAKAALDQQMVMKAPLVFIWTSIFERTMWKYKQRGFRYIFLDTGHIAAHLSLCAVDCGLGSCQIAAFYDTELNQILEVDGERESAVYMSVVGHADPNHSF